MGPNSIISVTKRRTRDGITFGFLLHQSCGRLRRKWPSQRYLIQSQRKNTKIEGTIRLERKINVKNQ